MTSSCDAVLTEVRSAIGGLLESLAKRDGGASRLLDVGCWDGAETVHSASLLGARPHGIEIFPGPAQAAEARGVEVARVDLETGAFPWRTARSTS